MVFLKLCLFTALVFLVSCNDYAVLNTNKTVPKPAPKYSFPHFLGLDQDLNFTLSSVDQNITGVANDLDDDSLIAVGFIEGQLYDGSTSQGKDLFVFKATHEGEIVWSILLNDQHPLVQDASGNESATNIVIDQANNVFYISGVTNGSFVESNPSGTNDIVIAKFTTNGTPLWIRQLGQETQAALRVSLNLPTLDLSYADRIGDMKLNPSGQLVASFDTAGSVFDTNTGTLGTHTDVGALLFNSVNGNLLKGVQIGAQAVSSFSGNSAATEGVSQSSFAFDGNKVVVPFRTAGALADTYAGTGNDAAYFVVDANFQIERIVQVGGATYGNWQSQGNYAGSINADDQFRSVLVNASGDYLFYGKTSSSMSEVVGNVDVIFARFVNHTLTSILQYGATTLPTASNTEEPRHLVRASNGEIYCSGHTRSDLLSEGSAYYKPYIFKVDASGVLQEQYVVSNAEKTSQGILTNKHILVVTQEFVVTDDQIRAAFNVSSTGTSGPFSSYLWTIER